VPHLLKEVTQMSGSNSVPSIKPVPEPLPMTAAGFLAHRKLKSRRTVNDMVEEVHLLLADDEQYVEYLNAVWDEQAVEGSLSADNLMAAQMVRTRAKAIGNGAQSEKLATISKSINVILRRYGFSRKERRDTVAGEIVRNEGGE
jgi:hypothetical protein